MKIIAYVTDEWAFAHFFFPNAKERHPQCRDMRQLLTDDLTVYELKTMAESRTTYREKIRQLVEPIIESEGMEIIELECLKMKYRWLVRIYIDKEGGVTIDDCSEISKQSGDVLDVYDLLPGSYTLEVSSPGLDRPLTRDKDFMKYRGSTIHIKTVEKLDGVRNFRGRLNDYLDENGMKTLIVDVSGKIYHIPRDMVVKARLIYEL